MTVVDRTLGVDPVVPLVPPKPDPAPDPQPAPKITVASYDPLLKAGADWHVEFSNSDGTRFVVSKDAQDRLWIDAANTGRARCDRHRAPAHRRRPLTRTRTGA
jgi:hypothetical protein